MKFKLKGSWIGGRIIDVDESAGGIKLPTGDFKITALMLVDQIGPDVKNAKVGDLIVYLSMRHIIMRDGTRLGVVEDDGKNVIATIEDADLERMVSTSDGKRLVDAKPAAVVAG